MEHYSAAEFVPNTKSLHTLQIAAEHCKGCPLFKRATQTVFGEGPKHSDLMLIGEAPGDEEDRRGYPFVGAAGRLLDAALEAAGIARERTYVTNIVKHFKWELRGKRRLHAKPNAGEIRACRPWLDQELNIVVPRVIVCLGATAAQTLLGAKFRITKQRGQWQENEIHARIIATYHPSAILRAPDKSSRESMRLALVQDLRTAISSHA